MGLLVTASLIIPVDTQYAWHGEIVNFSGIHRCFPLKLITSPFYPAMFWLHLILATVCPFIIILVMNVLIIIKLRTSGEFNKNSSSRKLGNDRGLVLMLFGISVAFVVLTAPAMVTNLYQMVTHKIVHQNVLEITMAIFAFNSCINFYMYCLSGSRFREELKAMICGKLSADKQYETNMTSVRFI